jgi:transposase
MNATSIGVDLSKSVFQLSLANQAGRVVERKRLSRSQYERFLSEQPQAEIVMEACATAHHWARTARRHGHDPFLLHAQYVRPYVRRNKTDARMPMRCNDTDKARDSKPGQQYAMPERAQQEKSNG